MYTKLTLRPRIRPRNCRKLTIRPRTWFSQLHPLYPPCDAHRRLRESTECLEGLPGLSGPPGGRPDGNKVEKQNLGLRKNPVFVLCCRVCTREHKVLNTESQKRKVKKLKILQVRRPRKVDNKTTKCTQS